MLSKASWAACWLALTLSLSSCTSDDEPSTLLIAIAAGAPLAERIDRIVITSDRDQYTAHVGDSGNGKEGHKLPFSLTIQGHPGLHTRVEVRAYAGTQALVIRSARVDLDGAGHRLWRLVLSERCEGVECGADTTCLDCSGTCADNRLQESALQAIGGSEDGVTGWQEPYCIAQNELSDGGDPEPSDADDGAIGQPESDASLDGALPPGDDAAMAVVATLGLRAPKVVAAPGCVAITVTRSDANGALAFRLSAAGGTTFYADDKCLQSLVDPAFEAGSTSATFYFAPSLPEGSRTGSIKLAVQAGAASAEQALEVRMRALQVSRGYLVGCALLVDGSLFCQGDRGSARLGVSPGDQGQIPVPTRGVPALTANQAASARLFGEEAHTCVQVGDSLRCFGSNGGALGNATNEDSIAWVTPQGLGQKVLQADIGIDQTCAVEDMGSGDTRLLCFGANEAGQCGPGAARILVPTAVTALSVAGVTSQVVQCGAGWGFTCARTADGEVYCFSKALQTDAVPPYPAHKMQFSPPANPSESQQGVISARELAVGVDVACIIGSVRGDAAEGVYCRHAQEPMKHIAGLPEGNIVRLRASLRSGCAQVGNELYCFGEAGDQWLGTEGATDYGTASRVELPAGKLEDFALGESDQPTLTALIDGLVYSWGFQFKGTLGIDPRLGYQFSPIGTDVLANVDATDVSFANSRSCALVLGTLRCWGMGRIGDGRSESFSDSAATALGLDQVTAFSADDFLVLALRNHELWSWGDSSFGQAGTGAASLSVPTKATHVSGNVTRVAADGWRSCLRFNDGSMGCLGAWNGDQSNLDPIQVLPPNAGDAEADVATKQNGACGVVGGSVKCVATTFTLPASDMPDFGDDVLELDGNGRTICARKADGTGHCMVDNAHLYFGSTGGPTVLDVRAGRTHACALLSDHTLWCAGDNTRAQLGQPSNVTWSDAPQRVPALGTVAQFDTGGDVTCARDESGWRCVGDNGNNGFGTSPWIIREPTLVAPWSD